MKTWIAGLPRPFARPAWAAVLGGVGLTRMPELTCSDDRQLCLLFVEQGTQPDLRAIVIGFEEAARPHGGSGALYVRLRRREG